MPDYTCSTCGQGFSLSQQIVDRYPGWTPTTCRSCRDGTSGNRSTRGGRKRPASAREENLTVAEVLARYSGGPQDGVFTDGSADPNPGPGGWGAVYVVDGEVVGFERGFEPNTTNNRMELTALIAGYDLVPEGTPATVYTDSRLCVDTITKWAEGWESRGWKRKSGPIANLELVQELYGRHKARPEIDLQWIAAHSGALWNEYADSLSTSYRRDEV
jgi:ribonuclease HI